MLQRCIVAKLLTVLYVLIFLNVFTHKHFPVFCVHVCTVQNTRIHGNCVYKIHNELKRLLLRIANVKLRKILRRFLPQ